MRLDLYTTKGFQRGRPAWVEAIWILLQPLLLLPFPGTFLRVLLLRLFGALRATTWMAAPLLAEIVCRWIADGTAARIVEAQRRAATERQILARRLLADFDYKAHPQSFYGMLHLPAPWRANDFVASAARRGIRLRAAEIFAVDQAPPEAVRICICAVETVEILTVGLERIVGLLREGPGADNLVV